MEKKPPHYGKPFAPYKKPGPKKPSKPPKSKPAKSPSPKMVAAKKRLTAKTKAGAIAGTKIKRNTKKSSKPNEYLLGTGAIKNVGSKIKARQKKQAERIGKMFPR